jgi:hypothetical protein
MEKFMYIFRDRFSEQELAQLSPEEIQADMQRWMEWIGSLGQQGKLVAAEQLHPQGKTVAGASKVIIDGPFPEGKEIVGGYLVVQAADMNEAIELSKSCPIFINDGSVEIRQLVKFS